MGTSEENPPSSTVQPTVLPSTPTTVRQSRLPVPSPSPWKTAFQPAPKKPADNQDIAIRPTPSFSNSHSKLSFHKSTDSNGSDQNLQRTDHCCPLTGTAAGRLNPKGEQRRASEAQGAEFAGTCVPSVHLDDPVTIHESLHNVQRHDGGLGWYWHSPSFHLSLENASQVLSTIASNPKEERLMG